MSAIALNILKPSVNNLTVRIFVRAAGLDFEEVDVWGKTREPEFLDKDPAHLTPMIEEGGLPRGSLWESCAIMQYLCNKHGLTQFYPADAAERAMVDSAMFYLICTLYPLVARATYGALSFPHYPGEVGSSDADDATKAQAQAVCQEALHPGRAAGSPRANGAQRRAGSRPCRPRHAPEALGLRRGLRAGVWLPARCSASVGRAPRAASRGRSCRC